MSDQHTYTIELSWRGNNEDPRTYDRSFVLSAPGKTPISGASDSASRGDPKKWNPEEMLLCSLASCHMLWYLYLCSNAKITVTEYQDNPTGILNIEPRGKSRFVEATINPEIVITDPSRIDEAIALHEQAHEKCYIVNSLNFEVKINPKVTGK
jgi:organic hydroperoxide reductase OsmC/OhrA